MKVVALDADMAYAVFKFLEAFGEMVDSKDLDFDKKVTEGDYMDATLGMLTDLASKDLLPDDTTVELMGAFSGIIYSLLFHKDIKTEKEEN